MAYLIYRHKVIINLAISDNQVRERCDSKIKKMELKIQKIGLTTIPREGFKSLTETSDPVVLDKV
jgi:hypothetical protein